MNRLKKKAYSDLAWIAGCMIVSAIGVGIGFHYNIQGPVPIISFVIPACLGLLWGTFHENKKFNQCDEREIKIIMRAGRLALCCFVIYIFFAAFTIFFIVGGKGRTPSYLFPVVVLIGFFMTGIINTFILLTYTVEGNEREIEGGAA